MTNIPTLDDVQLGPAMKKLTKLQRQFVHQLLMNGGNKAGAYIAAGYNPGSTQLAADGGHKLAFREDIQAAIVEYGRMYIGSKMGAWIKGVEMIANNNEAPADTRYKALKVLMEHGGMVIESKQKITVEHAVMNREESLQLERQLRKELGMPVIDVDYEEIEPVAEIEHAPAGDGSEGLEDLI